MSVIDETLKKMKERGPDFSSFFSKSFPNNLFIYLLHSRLSIIDLHPRSNQPLVIGDHVIIFNGEIYNYLELKKHLINKNPETLSFIRLFIEKFYNDLYIKNNSLISSYSDNKTKILTQIRNMKKFNLSEKNTYIWMKDILLNEAK